ncbi:MAG: oligosaccharide flippase family protein, partial [Bacteroidales bacterium]|nr:oligosaccharide flippase family protein [Bacteroidales bacterium]
FISPNYFYFLPLSILLLGSIKSFTQWLNRKKEFPYLAKTHIAQSGTASVVKISTGYFTSIGTWGLFAGHIAGQGIMFLSLLRKALKKYKSLIKKNFSKDINTELKEHKNFPIFAMPMGFLNIISKDIMLYVLNIFFNTSMVGLYANAQKASNYPLFFITQAFTSVFYQKLSETKNKVRLYLWSYIINFIIASIAMIPIVLWGEELFSFVLGKEWEIAGSIAKYLVPLTITSFAMRNVSNSFSLTKKNHILLIWQVIYLIIISIIIFLTHKYGFNKMILCFSIGGAILYIILAFVGLKILLNKEK